MSAIVPAILPAILPAIVPLAAVAPAAIESLLDAAFGPDRHARTAYRIRAGMAWLPALSFAGMAGERLLATIQCWPVDLVTPGGERVPLVLLGPVAVLPGHQRDGLGRRLMEATLAAAEALGGEDFVLIGDPEYYARFFGFTAAPTAGWDVPGPVERHRLLARLRGGRACPATGLLGPRRGCAAPHG